MPPRTALSTPLRAWRCPQCTLRSFTTSSLRSAVGPEHPQYIDVPQPPQPNVPYLPVVKGRLPVPRDVFAHAKKQDKASDAWIDRATKAPRQAVRTKPGSREEWKAKISAQRRQNLREGLKSLRERKTLEERILNDLSVPGAQESEWPRRCPPLDIICPFQVMSPTSRQHRWDVLRRVLDILHPHDSPEQNIFWRVRHARGHDARTINQIDPLHQRDVLPDFGLTRYGCRCADLLFPQRVDDGGFASIGIADEPNGYLFAGRMQRRKLAKK
nr:hypothetical protein CFP56_09271 [Quercus suber]